ncbi:hypothetical protein BC830DRAFT_475180 [Chytriomyces sp. MP71]|nr:hypothetical protein BC830DRAFT_475180 [Chytriomyces sp. MP71]
MIRQIVPIALRKQIATKTHISRREGAHVKALKENARDALVTSLAKFALLMLCLGAFVPMIAGNLLSSSPPANPGTKVTSQSPQAKKNNISLIHEIGSVEGSKAWKLPPPRRRYLALSAIPPSLHLFAEWTLIAQTLNRTLILPSLPQFWSTDAMDSATLVAAPFLGSVPLSQWLQIHPLNAKTGVEKGNSVRSGSVVAPLSEFLDVVEFDVWQAHLDARRNSTQEDLISIAFLKNVDEGVTCSAEHDDVCDVLCTWCRSLLTKFHPKACLAGLAL